MRHMLIGVVSSVVVLAGCGTGLDHVLVSNQSVDIAVNHVHELLFDLSVTALVSYRVTRRGAADDKWDVGLLDRTQWPAFEKGQPWTGAARQNGVADVTGSATLLPGSWAFGIDCQSTAHPCQLTFDLTANY